MIKKITFLSIKKLLKAIFYSYLLLQISACNTEEIDTIDNDVTLSTPDKFLTFFNAQNKLPSGSYTLVIATATAGQSGTFTLKLTRHDGSDPVMQTGQWVNSAGQSVTPTTTCTGDPANVCYELDLQTAEGISIQLSSALDGIIYVMDDSDNPVLVAQQNSGLSGETEELDFATSDFDQEQFASAYYKAVDPGNARDSLQKFISLHGFENPGHDARVTFRDSKDLGYGRDMYMRSYENTECGGQVIAFYVKNFSVEIVEGLAYGPVNLAAAVNKDFQHHFGTNAIEFSRGLISAGDTCTAQPFAKFFTYKSDYSSANASHPRLLTVNLDGRGEKAVPQPCITCHGGQIKPLDRFGRLVTVNANDSAAQIGDTKSRLQILEVNTFEFSTQSWQPRSDEEENIRLMNAAVFCSYPGSQGHAACTDFGGGISPQTDNGEWNADFSREVLLGWYNHMLEVPGTNFDNSVIPSGWMPSAGLVPEGADTLFKNVIAPNCFNCHGKRGDNLGENTNASGDGQSLDFSSYQKFINHAEDIRKLVYEEGRMPMSLLNYNDFWGDPEKTELLAAIIAPQVSDFIQKHVDGNGNIIAPAKTIARAGLDRVSKPDAEIRLNGHASLFADQFEWSVISKPESSTVTIDRETSAAINFSADTDGLYELQLTASSSSTNFSDADTLKVLLDSNLLKTPRSLTFYTDIVPTLVNCANSCHTVGGGLTPEAAGVPMWWVDDDSQPFGIPLSEADTPALGLFELVRSRINLQNIEQSQMLDKPAGNHHFGGLQDGFNTASTVGSVDRRNYELWVNWISEGAVCGGTVMQCP